ncbi:hypothetical protein PMIT1303_01541 [Prochlorococcus sp. MIT 1303]|nr:hypothetical protein PMIT1303_01541 [Prochlorococcus sp. MIT 1303]
MSSHSKVLRMFPVELRLAPIFEVGSIRNQFLTGLGAI